VNLRTAYLCLDCKEIQDGLKTGKCEHCGSEQVFALGWLMRSQQEREEWVDRVFGEILAPGTGGRL
jgi:hypothetical protein